MFWLLFCEYTQLVRLQKRPTQKRHTYSKNDVHKETYMWVYTARTFAKETYIKVPNMNAPAQKWRASMRQGVYVCVCLFYTFKRAIQTLIRVLPPHTHRNTHTLFFCLPLTHIDGGEGGGTHTHTRRERHIPSFSVCHTHTHTDTHSLALTHTLSLTHNAPVKVCQRYTAVSLAHTHTHTVIHTLFCSLSLTNQWQKYTLVSLTHTDTYTVTHSLPFSLSHTHAHPLPHTQRTCEGVTWV